MGAYNVVSAAAMVAGQPEDVSVVLANFNAIATVLNGGIDNSNINAAAAIAYAKLALGGNIVNADINVAAAIAASKFAGYPADIASILRGDGTWAKGLSALGDINLGANGIIDFTSIPQTFKHLLLMGMVRGAGASTTTDLDIRLNGFTGNSYAYQQLMGNNAAASAAQASGAAYIQTATNAIWANSAGANTFSPVIAFMPNYSDANKTQSIILMTANETAAMLSILHGWWPVNFATNQVTFTSGGLNQLNTGSRMTLYGLG
jgi:hypothetical protein